MLRAIVAFMTLCLIAGVSIGGYLALQACGLNNSLLRSWLPEMCSATDSTDIQNELVAQKAHNEALRREIDQVERAIAQLQCEAVYAEPEPVAPPPALPDFASPSEPAIDEEAWRAGDLGALSGCWELDSDYKVQHIQTGAITHYTQWRMCFDGNGHGTEEMTATNGTRCNGNVTGSFDDSGHLGIDEPGNLQCSDNTMIFRRVLNCALSGDGTASCTEFQPELGRSSTVRLRRTTGE